MKNTGFIAPQTFANNYVLGNINVPFKVLKEDGDWTANKRPEKELQIAHNYDTYNCTSFNTLNQIEQYMYVAFGETVNYSDRWLGIVAGTRPPGNDPHIVMEAIRKYGLIPESMLPFTMDIGTVDEYYSFKNADEEACRAEGLRWLEKNDFKHEWCFLPNQDIPLEEKIHNMKLSLKASPLSIAVYAWALDSRGVYIRYNNADTHWTSCYKIDDLQRVFDSYDPIEKNVNQEIFYAKRIHIEKRVVEVKKKLLERLLAWLLVEKLIYRAFKIFWIKNK